MTINRTVDRWTPEEGRVIKTDSALTISDLIAALQAIKDEHGDLDVVVNQPNRWVDGSITSPLWPEDGVPFEVVNTVSGFVAAEFGTKPGTDVQGPFLQLDAPA